MKKLNKCKFEITGTSPAWHERYNTILDRYIELRESGASSPVSGLSEDDCVTLAINMAQIDPGLEDDVDKEGILARIEGLLVTPVAFIDHVEVRVILPVNKIGKNTLSILLSAHACTWADPYHLSYQVLSINKAIIHSESEIAHYLSLSKKLMACHVLRAFHAFHRQVGGLPGLYHAAGARWYRQLAKLYKLTL